MSEYTKEDYLQDLRLTHYTYKKFFKNLSRYKDDLIQCALIYLYENRDKYDKTYTYATWAVKFSRFAMLNFLRDEKLKDGRGKCIDFISLTAPASNENDEDRTLADIIANEDDVVYNFDLDYLNAKIKECINQKKKVKNLDFKRYAKIINLCVTGLNYAQVAGKVGVSREYVRQVMDKFKHIFKQELIDDNYLEVGEYGK